ncbi:hypothetical protein YPPY34_4777, partial [Yersinia pestis PY-34]
MLVDRDRLGET